MWVVFWVLLVLAIFSGVMAWAEHHLYDEEDVDDQKWRKYYGWCAFFQGAFFAFLISAFSILGVLF